jgi:hypothetical protein
MGFAISGAAGGLAYFLPAIVTAFQVTGHTINRSAQSPHAQAAASPGVTADPVETAPGSPSPSSCSARTTTQSSVAPC